MESLLQYVWKHKLFPLEQLKTTDGLDVEVIDAGLQNHDAGPDFFNAKIKIGGTMWIGNVEIHGRSSAWCAHGHERDKAYDNVVLHVAADVDADVFTSAGRRVPQIRLRVPDKVAANYEALLSADRYPPCYGVLPRLDRLTVHAWLNRLLAECTTADQMRDLLATGVTPYWETHYTFGSVSRRSSKRLSAASLDLLIVNTAVPMLFAYGRYLGDEAMCGRAFDIMSQLKAEDNNVTRLWAECGVKAANAGDSQALMQLKREYCDRKDCLRCRIGYEYLRRAGE